MIDKFSVTKQENKNTKNNGKQISGLKKFMKNNSKLIVVGVVLITGLAVGGILVRNKTKTRSSASGASLNFTLLNDQVEGNTHNGKPVLDINKDQTDGGFAIVMKTTDKTTAVDISINYEQTGGLHVTQDLGRVNPEKFGLKTLRITETPGVARYLGFVTPNTEVTGTFNIGNLKFTPGQGNVDENTYIHVFLDGNKSFYMAKGQRSQNQFNTTPEIYIRVLDSDTGNQEPPTPPEPPEGDDKVTVNVNVSNWNLNPSDDTIRAGESITYTINNVTPNDWQTNIKAVFSTSISGPTDSEVQAAKDDRHRVVNSRTMTITTSEQDVGKYLYFVVNASKRINGHLVICKWDGTWYDPDSILSENAACTNNSVTDPITVERGVDTVNIYINPGTLNTGEKVLHPGDTVTYTAGSYISGWDINIKPVFSTVANPTISDPVFSSDVQGTKKCNKNGGNSCTVRITNDNVGKYLHFVVNLRKMKEGDSDPHDALYCTWSRGHGQDNINGLTSPNFDVARTIIPPDEKWVCDNRSLSSSAGIYIEESF